MRQIHTGCVVLEFTSNSRIWGFPAAASCLLSGVISSRLTCCRCHTTESDHIGNLKNHKKKRKNSS